MMKLLDDTPEASTITNTAKNELLECNLLVCRADEAREHFIQEIENRDAQGYAIDDEKLLVESEKLRALELSLVGIAVLRHRNPMADVAIYDQIMRAYEQVSGNSRENPTLKENQWLYFAQADSVCVTVYIDPNIAPKTDLHKRISEILIKVLDQVDANRQAALLEITEMLSKTSVDSE